MNETVERLAGVETLTLHLTPGIDPPRRVSSAMSQSCPWCCEVACDDDCPVADLREPGDQVTWLVAGGEVWWVNLSQVDRENATPEFFPAAEATAIDEGPA